MTQDDVMEIMQAAIMLALKLALPVLIVESGCRGAYAIFPRAVDD